MSCIRADELLELVRKAQDAAGACGKVVVAFRAPVRRAVVETLMADPCVSGVILANEAERRPFGSNPDIGFAHGPSLSEWTFPRRRATAAVLVGPIASIGLRIAVSAFRHGIRVFVTAGSALDPVRIDPASALLRRLVTERLKGLTARIATLSFALYRKALTTRIGAVVRPFEPAGLLVGEILFTRRARRLLRRARVARVEIGPPTSTVLLAAGGLGSGGSERQCVNTALMIKRDGRFRPIVVCARMHSPGGSFYLPLLQEVGVEVIDLYGESSVMSRDPSCEALLSVCKTEGEKLGYDIPEDLFRYVLVLLHERPRIVHSFLDENNAKIGLAAVLTQVPRIVMSARSVAPDNFELLRGYMRPGYKLLLRHPEVLICNNSRSGAADYRRWLEDPDLNIAILHNGIDFESFETRTSIDRTLRRELGVPDDVLLVTSVMRMSEEKQPLLWARAAIEISRRRPDVHFALLGDGPLRAQFEQIVAAAQIDSRVCLLAPRLDVPALLRASDLFLLTSRVEGLPNVLIEAQAVGLPVVTTPAGGAAETLDPGRTGLVAPDHSVRAIADTCLVLLDDDALRARMAVAAPDFVRRHFSLEQMYTGTLRLYEA